ncbi:hypothetical protein TURU_093103 [Turdus rufiventris]|nr:hypothetical protein TURU_093103 [Turdus rufiventris]
MCKDIHLWHETSWDNVKCYNISSGVEDFHVTICIQKAEVLQIYKEDEIVMACMDQKQHGAPQCQHINTLTQLGIASKLIGGVLDPLVQIFDPLVQIFDKDIKQDWRIPGLGEPLS